MTTKRVRTPLVCICPDCFQGKTWQRTKHGMVIQACQTCGGTGEVVRWFNQVVHLDEAEEVTE